MIDLTDEDKEFISGQDLEDLKTAIGSNGGLMNKDGREYKFQMDWTMGNQMAHVRCDDWEDFVRSKNLMEGILPKPKEKEFPNDEGPRATPQSQISTAPVCPVHNMTMVLKPAGVSKSTGKPYPAFWSCPDRTDGYCNYRPPKG